MLGMSASEPGHLDIDQTDVACCLASVLGKYGEMQLMVLIVGEGLAI